MSYSEKTVLTSVNVNVEKEVISVMWSNIVEKDGVEIARTPHRKVYAAKQKAEFLAEVVGGQDYANLLGW